MRAALQTLPPSTLAGTSLPTLNVVISMSEPVKPISDEPYFDTAVIRVAWPRRDDWSPGEVIHRACDRIDAQFEQITSLQNQLGAAEELIEAKDSHIAWQGDRFRAAQKRATAAEAVVEAAAAQAFCRWSIPRSPDTCTWPRRSWDHVGPCPGCELTLTLARYHSTKEGE